MAIAGGGGGNPEQLLATISDGNGLIIKVYGLEVSGGLQIRLDLVSGQADLRAFYLDMNQFVNASVSGADVTAYKAADEGVTKVGSSDTNMNGTGEKFDLGVELGTAGIGSDNIHSTTFVVQGLNFLNIDNAEFGIRATSVGDGLDGGVKLVGTLDAITLNG